MSWVPLATLSTSSPATNSVVQSASPQIVVNKQDRPSKRDGLQSIPRRVVKKLEDETLVKPGLCFHGLRHTPGVALHDLGLDREAHNAALGHVSDAASMCTSVAPAH